MHSLAFLPFTACQMHLMHFKVIEKALGVQTLEHSAQPSPPSAINSIQNTTGARAPPESHPRGHFPLLSGPYCIAKMTRSKWNLETCTKVCTGVNLHSKLFWERCCLTTWTAVCMVHSLIFICINKLCILFRNVNVKEHAEAFPFAEVMLRT